ncbi:hypothetical protein K437DRAFT_259909 [Tilletiaria anomala UBC 951]|uniref:Zn(2)-C6 fungal-type domain-containing protein n=1 Tax=Tilletiaria anomala (strain ATCC 24038 / CBS 436.72 / UBC 951) TaxID=1037660 RepID=A0A066VEX6_TILAU|nr:uncharacterized protein K437DRAFT_259909 [Tilletiaria anomala UBC 951]KDN37150.1 hypothetical protein K437DRAFT_259909 [Tilletiaria anomala UBC 951]
MTTSTLQQQTTIDSSGNGEHIAVRQVRRRERVPKSCIPCLTAKRKCDRGQPECARCQKSLTTHCHYDSRLGRIQARSAGKAGRLAASERGSCAFQKQPSTDSVTNASNSEAESEDEHSSETLPSGAPAPDQWASHVPLSPPLGSLTQPLDGGSRSSDSPPLKKIRLGGDPADQLFAMHRQLSDSQAQVAHLSQLLALQRSGSAAAASEQHANKFRSSLDIPKSATTAPVDSHTIAAQALSSLSQDFGLANSKSDRNARAMRAFSLRSNNPPTKRCAVQDVETHTEPFARIYPRAEAHASRAVSGGQTAAGSPRISSASTSTHYGYGSAHMGTLSTINATTTASRVTSVSTVTNGNGQAMYFGDGAAGVDVLETVSSHRRAQALSGAGGKAPVRVDSQGQPGVDAIRRDLQDAFTVFLHTEHEAFPFYTTWSSDPAVFVEEVSPLFHSPSENIDDLHSFTQSFACRWPALGGDAFILRAQRFFNMPIKEKLRTPLPMIAEYLMVIALGQHCDLDNPQLGAFHASQIQTRTDGADGRKHSSRSPFHLTDTHLSATYQALRLCSFLSSPSLETIHAQLLIGVYLRNTERSSSFWPLLGSIARQAQSIGLHVDPSKFRTPLSEEEKQLRRLLWWAIVIQDAQLSGVFGRPLAITHFSTRIGEAEGLATSHHEVQCELARLARKRLDESQIVDWTAEQLDVWTTNALDWYATLPDCLRLDFSSDALADEAPRQSAEVEKRLLSSTCPSRGLKAMQQACDLAMDFSAELIFAHRPRLHESLASTQSPSGRAAKSVCAYAIRGIRIALYLMVEHLGPLRTSLVWRTIYISFQAAATAAFICLMFPFDERSKENFEGLCEITSLTDKAPNRWGELVKVKRALNILQRLTSARMESLRELPDMQVPPNNSSDSGLKNAAALVAVRTDSDLHQSSADPTPAPSFDPGDVLSSENPSFEPPFKFLDMSAPTPGSQLNPPPANLPESEVVAWWSEFFSIPFNVNDIFGAEGGGNA